ncbi:hypothetical protein D3C81_493170 [compost metagenome]
MPNARPSCQDPSPRHASPLPSVSMAAQRPAQGPGGPAQRTHVAGAVPDPWPGHPGQLAVLPRIRRDAGRRAHIDAAGVVHGRPGAGMRGDDPARPFPRCGNAVPDNAVGHPGRRPSDAWLLCSGRQSDRSVHDPDHWRPRTGTTGAMVDPVRAAAGRRLWLHGRCTAPARRRRIHRTCLQSPAFGAVRLHAGDAGAGPHGHRAARKPRRIDSPAAGTTARDARA